MSGVVLPVQYIVSNHLCGGMILQNSCTAANVVVMI